MNKRYIVANLKSHLNEAEALGWLNKFLENKKNINKIQDKEIIIAPSFNLLPVFKSLLLDTNIKLCAQDLSAFDEGAYTGEVNGRQIKDYAEYVIVGHSERRINLKETDEIIFKKVEMAIKYGLKTIYCVQDKNTSVPKGANILAYEPVFAIGSGIPDTIESAQGVCESFIAKNVESIVLYGGSVTSENVNNFTKGDKIRGVLVGGASLNPQEFISIIKNA